MQRLNPITRTIKLVVLGALAFLITSARKFFLAGPAVSEVGLGKPEIEVDGRQKSNGGTKEFTSGVEFDEGYIHDLRTSLVDSAAISTGLWLSYLLSLFYLLVAAGSVTHRDLFMQNPVKLPFLNVDLPLVGFFVIGPAIFVVLHVYVLLHFAMFANKVGTFDEALRKYVKDEEERRKIRLQLPSNIFVQYLAGTREIRRGIFGAMLRVIAHVSLVVGPVTLLLFFDLQFLPYHSESITWWHRAAIAIDLAIIWLLWPSILRGNIGKTASRPRIQRISGLMFLASVSVVLLSVVVCTFPGEWLDNNLPKLKYLSSIQKIIVAGDVDIDARLPGSYFSNRLVLPGIDVVDHSKYDTDAKLSAVRETVSLRARHLEGAVLIGANLPKADFSAAWLQNADLSDANLREANFSCQARAPCTQLQGAILNFAQLDGANLESALLQGSSLVGAHLLGTNLNFAQLQGASMNLAQLNLASLQGAQLQAASLKGVQFRGAWLEDAQLQATEMDNAQLQGASLKHTQLQGATIENADFKRAWLEGVFVWRTDVRLAKIEGSIIRKSVTENKQPCWSNGPSICELKDSLSDYILSRVSQEIPEGQLKKAAVDRVKSRLSPGTGGNSDDVTQKAWVDADSSANFEEGSENWKIHGSNLADEWQKIGCSSDGAPAMRRMLDWYEGPKMSALPFAPLFESWPKLAEMFLNADRCASLYQISEGDKSRLRAIRARKM